MRLLRGELPANELAGQTVILVDDGLASGVTMCTTIEAVRHAGAERIRVATGTAHVESARKVAAACDGLYCPNIRGGEVFAVADAYRNWADVTEEQAAEMLREFVERRRQENAA